MLNVNLLELTNLSPSALSPKPYRLAMGFRGGPSASLRNTMGLG